MNDNKSQIDFQGLMINLLSKLSDREQDILKQRYHLTSELNKKATLKQIGDIYNITRERVRQIEREAIRKLLELKSDKEFAPSLTTLEEEIVNFLEKKGGLSREDEMLSEHVAANHKFDFFHTNSFLFALEHLIDSVSKIEDNEYVYAIWKLNDLDLDKVLALLSDLEKQVGKENKVFGKDEILATAEKSISPELRADLALYLTKHNLDINAILDSYLSASTKVEKNILEQWGLADWDTIGPKKLGDKIHLIFLKETTPLHFRDIADKINESKFDHKKICAATVHNELIANDKYILIGRGIYALKDWGYVSGTVAEIIESILASASEPMSKDDIYNEVLKQRQVNKSTIYLTLINKDRFEKVTDGRFELKK